MKRDQVAWAAGFFDGEGHIYVKPSRRGFVPLIRVGQVTRLPLDTLRTLFDGGSISAVQRNGRPYYRWEAQFAIAREALRLMLPHLQVKGDLASRFINARSQAELEALKEFTNSHPTRTATGQHP